MRRGLCRKCHTQWIRDGGDMSIVPPQYARKKARKEHLPDCIICGRPHRYGEGVDGRCHRCYMYRYKHGVDWTPAVGKRGKYDPAPMCKDCKMRKAYYTHPTYLCMRCFNYRRRNDGKRRPRYKDADCCLNCGKQRDFSNPKNFLKGRCHACYRYWMRRNCTAERPESLWNKGEYGWCDCGKPATHSVQISIHKHTESMHLCDMCHAEYMRQVRWYGENRRVAAMAGDD